MNITNSSANTLISGTNGNDYIANVWRNVTIKAFNGNDTINNEGSYAIIDAGSGNDSVRNTGFYVSITGGGSVLFDNVTTSTNFNINGTSYKISGSKLVKK